MKYTKRFNLMERRNEPQRVEDFCPKSHFQRVAQGELKTSNLAPKPTITAAPRSGFKCIKDSQQLSHPMIQANT
jgi:hypothetical protein